MNSEIEKQLVSSELRRKFTEELKIRTKGLIGRPVNEKSKIDFSNIIKETMKKNEVTIIFDEEGNPVIPSKFIRK